MIAVIQTIDDYLDLARTHAGLASDRAIARALNRSATAINGWRMKRQWPDDEAIIALARLAGSDPERALIDLNIWRAKSPEARDEYQKLLDRHRAKCPQ